MKKIFTEKLGQYLLITGVVLLILAAIVFFWNDCAISFDDKIRADKVGQFGDVVGGLIGSIWALAGVVLFYVALTEQRKDFVTNRKVLESQTEALTLQLEEFKFQRLELSETREVIKIQKFETSFFNLLKFHNEITNALFIRVDKRKSVDGVVDKEVFLFDGVRFFIKGNQLVENHLYELKNLGVLMGQNIDDSMMRYVKNNFKSKFIDVIQNLVIEKGTLVSQEIAFLRLYESYETVINRYMKQFLIIIKHIDKTDKEINDFSSDVYVCLLKAQLSDLELKFIWIYCQIFSLKEEFELLKKYSFIPQTVPLFKPNKYES